LKVRALLMENIRSHKKTLINFQDGFTCLIGGLGRGKSSILYAIDFALFGDPLGRSYEYLLREGSDRGRVALKFVVEGKEYTIWRAIRRRGKGIGQDMEQLKLFEGDRLIAEMKGEAVAEQLKAITGIDKDLFREVMWIRQEHLKDLLDMRPTERRRRLDALFGLSDYEAAWTNTRSIINWYESELNTLERDPEIARIEEFEREYDKAVRELAEKEEELHDLRDRLSRAEVRLREATARLEQLEALRRRNEELRAREADLRSRLMAVERLSARLTKEIKSMEESRRSLESWVSRLRDEEASKRALLKEVGLPCDSAVETLKRVMDSLVEQLAEIQAEEEHARREMVTSDRRVSTLTRESRCPLCLQPLPPSYKDDLLKRIHREAIKYKERISELRRRAEDLERRKRTLSSVLSKLQTIEARVEDVERRIKEECERLEKTKVEFDEKGREAEEVRERLAELRAEMAKIDLRELEEAQRLRERAFDEYSELKQGVRVVESQMREIASRMDSLKERLDSAYSKVERMKNVRRLLEILREIRQAYRSIQPRLRGEFVKYLERMVQQVLDELLGFGEPPLFVDIDEDYTPSIRSEEGHERSVANLSGGERTFLAFAYRMGVGQIIMQSRVGHGPRMLLLDEPTESLGREDGSIDRLAEALSRLKTVEQIIAVTHSEAFAEKADHVARVTKENNVSKVSVER